MDPNVGLEMLARAADYARWADAKKLRETRPGAYEGLVRGRGLVFTTGLAGSGPLSPDLVLAVDLDAPQPTLFRRGASSSWEGPLAPLPACVFGATAGARAVGVTSSIVRVTFDKMVDADAFDRALDAVDEALHELAASRATAPYRG